jgi:hypothetical protein
MGHSILSLQDQRFNPRVALGGCLININGETVSCEVSIDKTRFTWPKYTVKNEHGEVLCAFTPDDLWDGPIIYSICREASRLSSASLIVPGHGLMKKDEDDEDEETNDCEDTAEI